MDSVGEVGRFGVSSVSEVGWLSLVGGMPVRGVSVGGVPVGGVPVGGVPVGGVSVDAVGVVTSEVLLPEIEVAIFRDEYSLLRN